MKNKRPNNVSKNDFGHVLIIGGDYGMGGAVIMAAESCYRVGAGKVTVLTHQENISALLTRVPSAMSIVADGELNEEIFTGKTVIVIGCGLGRSNWGRKLFALVMNSDLPKVIDADALNILSEIDSTHKLQNCVITPHAGEAGRLLKISSQKIQQDRQSAIKELGKKFASVAILKGHETLVLSKNGKIYQCPYGNPGMATAGMGDILSGIIGGLIAQGLNIEEAAIEAVNIHAQAGDLVAKEQGQIGMVPGDLIKYLPRIINDKIECA
jgi:hydroxyethylthiazole kinase-like uncharacterized protein yjeF